MRGLFMVAAGFAAVAVYAARIADNNAASVATDLRPPGPMRAASDPPPQSGGLRSVTLSSDGQGHFQVDARVDGARIPFIVDSGASVVVLRESDAAMAGIHPSPRDYSATVSTANGKINAAPARLSRVDVGGIVVQDVEALVLPNDVLGQNLLGVSFLSRLTRYQYANGRMVLEQ
jgi:aspartyl protease family protein